MDIREKLNTTWQVAKSPWTLWGLPFLGFVFDGIMDSVFWDGETLMSALSQAWHVVVTLVDKPEFEWLMLAFAVYCFFMAAKSVRAHNQDLAEKARCAQEALARSTEEKILPHTQRVEVLAHYMIASQRHRALRAAQDTWETSFEQDLTIYADLYRSLGHAPHAICDTSSEKAVVAALQPIGLNLPDLTIGDIDIQETQLPEGMVIAEPTNANDVKRLVCRQGRISDFFKANVAKEAASMDRYMQRFTQSVAHDELLE